MSTIEKNTIISRAVGRAISPLVRMLMHWGIGFKDFSYYLKQSYLNEGKETLKSRGKEVTASSLSLVTGLHRKETTLYLHESKEEALETSKKQKSSAAFSILSAWITQPCYLDDQNKPIALPYLPLKNSKSFTSLCESITKDVHAKTILEELLRLNLVQTKGETVIMRKSAFIPDNDFEKKLALFSKNISEHLEAASSNVIGENPPLFERMAIHDNMSEKDIQEFRKYIEKKGMEFLIDVYQKAENLIEDRPAGQKKDRYISLGIFFNTGKKKVTDNE